jgi:hypothetical protein
VISTMVALATVCFTALALSTSPSPAALRTAMLRLRGEMDERCDLALAPLEEVAALRKSRNATAPIAAVTPAAAAAIAPPPPPPPRRGPVLRGLRWEVSPAAVAPPPPPPPPPPLSLRERLDADADAVLQPAVEGTRSFQQAQKKAERAAAREAREAERQRRSRRRATASQPRPSAPERAALWMERKYVEVTGDDPWSQAGDDLS